jgi:RNA polymerase-binding transcription factor DksA
MPSVMERRIEQTARDTLIDRRRALRALSVVQAALEGDAGEERESDPLDRAAIAETVSGIEHLRRIEDGELAAIDRALARLEAGTFGRCVNCRDAIDPRRLEVIPWAETCVGCAVERSPR